ncbi:MAG TPA: hypothetical protein VEA69_15955 [Tepidisphaeraceae bacterium]|nr:hypothetical protein [Tepidisphaeraceae bacterium]
MPRLLLFLSLAFLLGAGRVQTRDGKSLAGDVALDAGHVVVTTNGAAARIPLDQVASAELAVTPTPKTEVATTGTLPAGWKSQDLGRVKSPGSAKCDSGGLFTLTASGWGAFGATDSLHYAYRTLDGDGQIIARVAKLDDTAGPTIAGVMIRQSLAPDSPMATATLYPTGEVRMGKRPMFPTRGFRGGDEALKNPTAWVRLTRKGTAVAAFRSTDGKFWEHIETRQIPLTGPVLVGVCAFTTGNDWTGSATVDSVQVIPGAPGFTYFPGSDPLAAGVVFTDGSATACDVIGVTPTAVRALIDGRGVVFPREAVARIVFNPMPADLPAPGAPSALLTSGDLFDGDLADITMVAPVYGQPKIPRATFRNVLFGNKTFDARTQLVAIDLAPLTPTPAAWELRTTDGSIVRAQKIALDKAGVTVDDEPAPRPDIVTIRKP